MGDLPSILDLLDLEYIEQDIYRSCVTFTEPHALFGGQVAAQALYAAGKTVPEGRLPHSLHGYFLRAGDTRRPTLFRIERDRDGSSFSARRVVAIQNGEVIFNMAASFSAPRPSPQGPSAQALPDGDATPPPAFPPVGGLPAWKSSRHASFEFRQAPSPHRISEKFWIKCLDPLPPVEEDPLFHAAVLTYISDIGTGLVAMETPGYHAASSVDHAVWFHRQAQMGDWVWVDLRPETVAGGRGWYTGAYYTPDGARVASLAQEMLFRKVLTT
jgi:acyl-CoA thioesterase-2